MEKAATYTPKAEVVNRTHTQEMEALRLKKKIADTEQLTSMANLQTARINLRFQMRDLMQNSPEVYQQIKAQKEQQQLAEEQAEQARQQIFSDNIARLQTMQTERVANRSQPSSVADIRDYRKMDLNTAQGSSDALGEAMARTSETFNRTPETNETPAPRKTIEEMVAELKTKYGFAGKQEQPTETADLSANNSHYGSVSLNGSIPYTASNSFESGSYAAGNNTFSYQTATPTTTYTAAGQSPA